MVVDEEVESVIEVGGRSEDESDDFMVVTKHCQRTRSGREVKKPCRKIDPFYRVSLQRFAF
jgi:hypothetical protein